MIGRLAAIAAIVAGTCVARAQQPSFKTETRLVVLHATVRNRRGVEITNLDRGAFTVYENGKRQPIMLFRRDDIPVSIGLLVDNSGSMRPLRERAEAAALAFVRASNPLDEAFVVNFADTARIDVAMTQDVATLEAGIRRVDSIGGTALRDAVRVAETYLHDHATRDRRVLLVITDGRDNASLVTMREIEQHSRASDTAVYAIGVFAADSSEAKDGKRELDALAERSGGVAYYPSGPDEVVGAAQDIAQQIRRQYTIAYAPSNQRLDGSYRTIRVEARGEEPLTVRTRSGYLAVPSVTSRHDRDRASFFSFLTLACYSRPIRCVS
ncbi:MAG TPA: VWA domain-containing protein [Vicinamibacterales bacterium]|nr:VWA domain-containing protein [Vicinamibacterales bacterium]